MFWPGMKVILYILQQIMLKNSQIFSYETFRDPGRMQVYTQWGEQTLAEIDKDTQIRYQGGIKSEILKEVTQGSQVMVLEEMDTG